ncbi:Mitochondrial inner membrane protease subunit 2 [Pyrenophora teres f. teres]|uniref:Mitochondrial inner membrane protease subunit n=1 Tax=Pyrenophora teres f. teres TaxID=97479 RepID=A0A6S6VZ45_9PLEO|nr:Mitochondrial inner membrane protease subunit 2 [Pyrenophora teres f. teres]
MPPKPPLRLPAKPRTTSIPHVKPALPDRPVKPLPRGAPPPPPPPPSPRFPSKPSAPRRPQSQWLDQRALGSPHRYWLKWGINGIVLCSGLLCIRDYMFEMQAVRGTSMSPTLNPHTHETGSSESVLIRRYIPRTREGGSGSGSEQGRAWGIQRGDVVTFWKPHRPGEMGIKRVVAVEGDTVYPTRGYAVDAGAKVGRLSGMPDGFLDEDVGSVVHGREEHGDGVAKVVVPYGHVWLEGDNARSSLDSNFFGPVSKGLVQGKAVRVWSGWFGWRHVGDARGEGERRLASRVVEGRSEVPPVFLE